eukprot:scaffold27078_cov77-Skeletonema_dohrnii-CCMP3373.AAC.6
MGIGQGCTPAPPGFNAVSTLLINAYKKMGHDLEFRAGWSDVVASLAAILYVDDTDLLLNNNFGYNSTSGIFPVPVKSSRLI